MDKKHKIFSYITAVAIALFSVVLSTNGVQEAFLFTRTRAVSVYTLKLDSTNAFNNSGSGTQNIYTKKGNTVPFSYTNCASLSGGHVKINEGGTIANDNQIASVSSVLANFTGSTSSTEFQFRASFDKATWGEWGSLASGKARELPSEPYYFEFKAVNGAVNLTSLTLEYTCIEHEGLQPGGGGSSTKEFVKVTSALDDYAGTYLIVCDSASVAFDGSLTTSTSTAITASGNKFSVDIVDEKIAYTDEIATKVFEITDDGEDRNGNMTYQIASHSGLKITNTADSNSMNVLAVDNSTDYYNWIGFYDNDGSDNDFYIKGSGGSYLRYNSSNTQFRYYKSSTYTGQAEVFLYKLSDGSKPIEIPEYEAKLQITDNNENYIYGHSFNETFGTENFSASVLMSNGTETAVDPNDLTIDIEKSGTHYAPNVELNSEGTYNVTISYGTLAPVKYQITVTKIVVTSITLDKQNLYIKPGESVTITTTVLPENAYDKSLTWTSSNSSVATVNNGTVKAVADGTATITVSSNNGVTATCSVNVSSSSPVDPGMETAYNAAIDAGNTATTSYYEFTGVVVGKRYNSSTNNDIYVQSGDYAMDVFKYSGYSNVTKGDEVTVSAKVKCYNGLPETDTISSLKINGTGVLPNENVITTASALESAKINTLVGVSATIKSIKNGSSNVSSLSNLSSTTASSNDINIVLTTTNGDVTVYLKKATYGDKVTVLKTFSTGDIMTISHGIRGIYKTTSATTHQILVAEESTITKGVPVHVDVTGISVSPTSADVSVNGTTQLTATISPGDASNKEVTWSSSNSAIASVDQNGLVTGHVAGQFAIIYAKSVENNNIQATCTVNVKAIAVTSVSLNKTTADMFVGGSDLTLSATVLPANATNKGVTWSSNNSAVASVNENGVVQAISEGSATITATTDDGGFKANCLVTVAGKPTNGEAVINKFETISGNIDDHISYQGLKGSGTSDAQVNTEELRIYQNGGYLLLTSDAETYITEVTIGSSMSTTVAYQTAELNRKTRALNENENYDLEANSTITFDGLATDEFKIICNGADKNHRLYVNYIDVKYAYNGGPGPSGDVEVTGVSVSPKSLKLTTGDTSTLSALVSPNNATNKAVTWSSDNTSVVTVSNTGKVTAVGVGNASVTATTQDGEFTDACNISVAAKVIAVTGVTLDKTTFTLNEGDDATLVATVAPSNATNKDVTWESSDGSVATVNASGKVVAVSAGNATITVKTVDGEKTATCNITVKTTQTGGGGGSTSTEYSSDITGSASGISSTDGTQTISVDGNSYGGKFKQYATTALWFTSGSGYIYNTTDLGNILDITIYYHNGGSPSAKQFLTMGTKAITSYQSGTAQITDSTGGSNHSFKQYVGTGNGFFNISISNKNLQADKIVIKYESSGSGGGGSTTTEVPVTGITMSKSTLNLSVGKTDTLSVSYTPSNATTGKGVTWSVTNSNPTGCVTVDSSGNVKAVSAGTAKVVATSTSNSQITATCNVTVEATPQAAWTIMMYVCGADLESESSLASGDFQEILKVSGQPSDVNIIIQTGGASKWATTYGINSSYNQRYHVENRKLVCDNSKVYSSYKSMGLSSTFADFVAWGLSEYPADKTGVVLWNHGGAMRGVCYDEKSNDDSLLNSEIKSGVASAFTKVGRSTSDKLEFIGYDACLMQAQDIAEFNSQYFNYMIASQESEAGYGWDYDNWVDDLYAKKSTETILTAIVDSFIADNGGASSRNGDQTLSWLNLAYMEEYKTAFESFASALKTKFGSSVSKNDFYTFMHNNVKYFGGESDDDEYFGMFDVIDFLNKIEANTKYNPGGSYISNVRSKFSNLVKYSVAQKGAGNANGLCCIYSKTSGNWLLGNNYSTSQTNFTNWRSFVSTYGQIS